MAKVERFLVDELHIGISTESSEFNTWSAGRGEDGRARMVRQSLAFGRVGGAYRIHVVEEVGIVDDAGAWQETVSRQETPWPSCGREAKLRAFEKLPQLLDNIITASERLAETADLTALKIGEITGEIKSTAATPELAPQFMTCPWCSEQGEWLNVESNHWGVCHDCHCKWPIGTNLLPSWQDETEAEWKRNAKLLAKYEDAG
jgi:hypothetical protein